ncbi:hypothetical protein SH661x_001918 [Planctomicrobium sp. SH661]|uniref:hypothetical protein n=1 Tax=Planctomicrobium sp. SH661 TaxID=3448124 RepID=UPI003F5BFE07
MPGKLKTLMQLREALRSLIDEREDVSASAKTYVVTQQEQNCRSKSVFHSGTINWRLPAQRGGFLSVTEVGDTFSEVYDRCRVALRRELEERGRARRIASAPTARVLPAPAPRRLEYQP